MTFRAHGSIERTQYSVQVDDDGTITGSTRLVALRGEIPTGRLLAVTPTGPYLPYDPDSAEGVLALLYARTNVTRIEGDAPTIDLGSAGLDPDDDRIY